MKIGNLEITTPVFLAPMAGVTDTAYCILLNVWAVVSFILKWSATKVLIFAMNEH